VRATICYEGEADKMSDIVTETLSQAVERQAREIERLRALLLDSQLLISSIYALEADAENLYKRIHEALSNVH
jgi:hypothetical protein